jgi:VanZ family protein
MPATDSSLPWCLRPLVALTIAYTLALVLATHYPEPEQLLGPNPPSDKTLHLLAYGGLGLLAAAVLAASGRWSLRSLAGLATGLAAFAAIDEATQPWFGRSAEPLDWAFDLAGLAAGIGAVTVARRWRCGAARGLGSRPRRSVQ